jgi:hypothetical protein
MGLHGVGVGGVQMSGRWRPGTGQPVRHGLSPDLLNELGARSGVRRVAPADDDGKQRPRGGPRGDEE